MKLAPHISDLISLDDICLVADKTPELFLDFVKQLRTVPSYSLTVSSKWSFLTKNLILRGSRERVEPCFWENEDGDSGSLDRRCFKIEPYIVPVKNIAGFRSQFLTAVVKAVDSLGTFEVFDNDVVQQVIQFKWETFVSRMFVRDFSLLVIMVILFFLNAIVFEPSLQAEAFRDRMYGHGLLLATSSLSSYFIAREVRLLLKANNYPRKMTVLHFVSICLVVTTLILQCRVSFFGDSSTKRSSTKTVAVMTAVTLPFLALEVIFALGGFHRYGPLVRMIVKMVDGIKEFSLILLILLIAFAGSIMVLFQGVDPTLLSYDGYSTLSRCMLTTYGFFFSQINLSDLDSSKSPQLAHTLVAIFLFVIVIVLLNLLIALMGE
jgi:hypothetical protein